MNHDQKVRYSRHLALPQIGEAGQEKLINSKVLVIGAGGLGSAALLYLSAAGIGTIGIVDDDKVELSNLQRQIIHETFEVGQAKTQSAKMAMMDLNPDITVHTHQVRLEAGNAHELIGAYDIVVDGSDNFETRYLINKTCHEAQKTLVWAAIEGFVGQISTCKSYRGAPHPCYGCLYPQEPAKGAIPRCVDTGVLGSVAGIMGAWQSAEVVKELLGIDNSLSGTLVLFDALSAVTHKVKIHPQEGCVHCGGAAKISKTPQ